MISVTLTRVVVGLEGLVLHLDPDSFSCPTHNQDLTPEVRQALEEEGLPPVAFGSHLLGAGSRRRDFEVIVPCPGTGPDAAHEVAFEGEYWT